MAFDAYLEIDGIPGECSDAGHKEWVELISYEMGAENVSNIGSKSGGAGAGKADFKKFVIEKQSDKTSPKLFLSLCQGKHIPKLTLDICRTGPDPKEPYIQIVFETCLVNSIYNQGSEASRSENPDAQDDFQIERVEFSCGKIEWTYKEQDKEGNLGGAIAAHWSRIENKGG